jgi:hypothetical protein
MALTKEQFNELRQRGLTVDQIVSFEQGGRPQSSQQSSQPGFFKSLVSDPVKTLLVKPAVRTGQALGYGVGKLMGIPTENLQRALNKDVETPVGTIEAQKAMGDGGFKQIVGDAAKTASYLYTGPGAVGAVQTGLKGQVLRGAYEGAKTGAIGGGAYSFGDAIQDAENQSADVAIKTLFGTALGGATGGVLGAATPLVVKGANVVSKYRNVGELNNELTQLNNITLKPTPTQQKKWSRQGVDPIKTYTEVFGNETPLVDKTNRFTRESIENMVERVDDVYRPASEGFNTILRNSPEVNSLSNVERQALAEIEDESLTAVQRLQAKAKIQNEIAALRQEAMQGGRLLGDDNIPVALSDNYKDRYWANTKYFGDETTTVSNSANRAIGHALAKNIEEVVTDVGVKAYNKQLQQYIVLKEFLEKKAGSLAGEGGKMTRLISRTVGSIAGAQGGPIGSIAGSLTGDALAQMWINPANSPARWLIMKQLKKLPQAERQSLEQQANEIIAKMYAKRMETLALPPPSGTSSINSGRPIIVSPNTPGVEYTGPDTAIGGYRSRSADATSNPMTTEQMKTSIDPTVPPTKKGGKNLQGGFISTGYKETGDLTTKILKDLEGKTTVSKQYILDATNRGDLKQAERDLIRELVEREGATVNVPEFAEKVKAELLPLEAHTSGSSIKPNRTSADYRLSPRYESISLPAELRGKIKDYRERIYNSPIQTSAAKTHFGSAANDVTGKGYFGHTRIEDMADNKTRRVIEVQSDLYQKGNLEKEVSLPNRIKRPQIEKEIADLEERIASDGGKFSRESDIKSLSEWKKTLAELNAGRGAEVAKLQQYNNPTAHFRMVREELKKAAQDGKTKLQFPTGETAMKIEGLGDHTTWSFIDDMKYTQKLTTDKLKVGQEVQQGTRGFGQMADREYPGQKWIITDVLGDGKFKAVPKSEYDFIVKADRSPRLTPESRQNLINQDLNSSRQNETFDISGKVDTNNPIYRFYEKDLQKYLNKFEGKRIVDDRGVSWIEVPIKKEMGTQAVEAFGKIAKNPLLVGAGIAAGVAGASKAMRTSSNTTYERDKTVKSETKSAPKESKYPELSKAVAYRESRGSKDPYTATNKNKDGTSDYGKYQVNEQTLKTYGKKFLGKDVTTAEFLKSPELQEQFFEKAVEHLKSKGVKSERAFLAFWHKGWGDISTARLNRLLADPGVAKYINTK